MRTIQKRENASTEKRVNSSVLFRAEFHSNGFQLEWVRNNLKSISSRLWQNERCRIGYQQQRENEREWEWEGEKSKRKRGREREREREAEGEVEGEGDEEGGTAPREKRERERERERDWWGRLETAGSAERVPFPPKNQWQEPREKKIRSSASPGAAGTLQSAAVAMTTTYYLPFSCCAFPFFSPPSISTLGCYVFFFLFIYLFIFSFYFSLLRIWTTTYIPSI